MKYEGCIAEDKEFCCVIENTDKDEGRGRSYISGVYLTYFQAIKAAKGQGICGSDAKVELKAGMLFTLFDEEPIYFAVLNKDLNRVEFPKTEEELKQKEELKKGALAKLTKEEKQVLGI